MCVYVATALTQWHGSPGQIKATNQCNNLPGRTPRAATPLAEHTHTSSAIEIEIEACNCNSLALTKIKRVMSINEEGNICDMHDYSMRLKIQIKKLQ